MAGKRRLTVEILGDAKGLAGSIKDAEGHLSSFGSKVAGVAKATALGLAGLGVGAVAIGKPLIDAAADLGETVSKVGVLFGDASGDIEKFAESAAKSFGQSKKQAMDAAATFATFGKAAGLQGKDLSRFSTDLVGLASDLASFNNTSPEEAIEAIGAALRGEAEPMRRYGVLLDDASMRQKALELGIIKTTKDALTPQQKILAAQALIFEQTSAAQGDFARTSGGLANQSRILKASLANVQAEIGEKLLPIAVALANFANEKLIPAIEATIRVFEEEGLGGVLGRAADIVKTQTPIIAQALWQWIVDTTPVVLGKLGELLGKLGNWFVDVALPKIQALLTQWGSALVQWIVDATPGVILALIGLSEKIGAWFGERAPGWAADAAAFVGQLPQKITEAASRIDWGSLLYDAGTQMSKGMLAGFMVGPGAFLLGIGRGSGAIQQGNILDPERRAGGGPVRAGQPYLVGERGPELIFPNRNGYVATANQSASMMSGGGSGTTIIVQGSVISERELLDVIRRAERRGLSFAGV
jgi:hypothetical protein